MVMACGSILGPGCCFCGQQHPQSGHLHEPRAPGDTLPALSLSTTVQFSTITKASRLSPKACSAQGHAFAV